MSILVGRCTNLEFCRLATLQKSTEIPDDEPFICPQCSSDLELVGTKRAAGGGGNRRGMIALQAAAIVAGAGVIGWKLLLAPAQHGTPELHAPRASSAEMALSANPDAPSDVPAAAEPKEAAALPASAKGSAATAAPAKILLRLTGSDIIAAHLARRLAAGYLALIGDTDIATEATPDAATIEITGSEGGQREAIAITTASSSAALAALGAGTADVAMTSRPITPAERTGLAKLGDMTSASNEHVIGVDAAVVVTNPGNPVTAISRAQLRAALSGTGADWSALGQKPRPMHVYMADTGGLPENSPAAILGGGTDSRAAIPLAGPADVLAAVKRDAGGIGIMEEADAAGGHVLAVSDAAAAAVTPSDASVAAEDYPLTRRFYFYNPAASATSFSRRFADYAASAPGQSVVAASGFVSLAVRPGVQEASAAPGSHSKAGAGPVDGATRLSTTFRFQSGSVALDTRAARDIDRLAAYLKGRDMDGSHVLLAGFADNTGTQAANQFVAEKRVETVADSLHRAGITVGQSKSFGAAFPVADNQTPEGRDRNRRVEVYVTEP